MPRRCDGFTLIESLVAMGLVVGIALGSAQLFTIAVARNLAAREQMAMSLLAATRVDDLAASAADGSIALSPADSLERSADGFAATAVDNGRSYILRWNVARMAGFGDDAVAIAVRVTPVDGPGDVRIATIREWRHP